MEYLTLSDEQKEEHRKWIELFESKYSFKFFEPSYNEVPYASKLFGAGNMKKYISRLEYNLLGTYIIDMNTNDHIEMHKIRQEFTEEEYRWHKKHNKLGANLIDSNGFTMILLEADMNKKFGVTDFPAEQYSSMKFLEKIELIKKFDENTYKILERLSKEYTMPGL
jgi:hypothetical protein